MPGSGRPRRGVRTYRGVVTPCAEGRARALLKEHRVVSTFYVESEAEHAFAELKDFNKAGESVLARWPSRRKSDAPPRKALGAFGTDTRRGDVSTVAEEVDAAQVVADTLYREVKDRLREECKIERTARVESFRHSVRDAFSRLEARVGLALVLWRLGRLEKARGTIKPKPKRQRATD